MGAAPSQDILDQTFWVCTSAKIFGVAVGLTLLAYMHCQAKKCESGDNYAVNSLILPVYRPVIYTLLFTMSTEIALLCIGQFGDEWLGEWQQILTWAVYELSRDGFVMLFVQQSLSRSALRRSLLLALLWPAFGVMCALILLRTDIGFYGPILFHGVSSFFNLIIALPLPGRLAIPRRVPIVPYCLWMSIYRGCWVVYYFIRMGYVEWLYYPILILAGIMELPVTGAWYYVMRTDTNFWHYGGDPMWRRWIGHDKVLERLEVGLLQDATQDVVQDQVQNMIESNRAHLVHFAHLRVDHTKMIGAGAFSRVFKGMYRGRRVAVKFFIRMMELTPDMVASFAKETHVHATLNHDNVIKFYGYV